MSETADSKIRIEVDAEGLRAYVRLEPAGDYRGVDGGQLLEALKAAGIEISEAVVKRSDEVAALLRAGKRPEEGLVVAEGSPASDGCDGRLEWAEGLDPTIQPINSE
ncbi:MAG: flagellar assembly protein A, partial [Phycisphaerae bacterium]